jgi:methyl-accepting chemotaxis protein
MNLDDKIRKFLLICTYSQKLAVVLLCTFLSFIFIVGGLWFTSQGLYRQAKLDYHTFPFQEKMGRLTNAFQMFRLESLYARLAKGSADRSAIEGRAEVVDHELDQFITLLKEYVTQENSKLFRQKLQFHVEEMEDFAKDWSEIKILSLDTDAVAFDEKSHQLFVNLRSGQIKLWEFFRLFWNDDEGTKRLVDLSFDTLPELTELTLNFFARALDIPPRGDFKLAELENVALRLQESLNRFEVQMDGLNELIDTPLERDTHRFLEESSIKISSIVNIFVAKASSTDPVDKASLYLLTQDAIRSYGTVQAKMYGFMKDMLATQVASMKFRLYVGYFLVFLALITVLVIYFAKVVLQPLKHLSEAANELAIGKVNIRIPITKNDEVGEIAAAFNALAAFLENTLREVKGVSNGLLESVQVILDVARKLERNIAIQDAELSVVKGHIKEIAVVVKEFSLLLKNVYKSINATTGFADVGRTSLSEMENVMQQIVDASESIVGTLGKLNRKICSINDVIGTIVKIADQISLLSLNTAIQANKAGPEGKGFTVIAKKIRELSGQTASSTLDIEDTVREIISSVDAATTEVNQFLEQVLLQVKDSTQLSDEFKKLIHFFQHQVEVFSSVNEDMAKQAESATELQEMLKELSDASKRTTLSVGQFYREIESLYQSTTSLVEKIDSFTHPSYILLAAGTPTEPKETP